MEVTAEGINKEFIRKSRGSNVFVAVDVCDMVLCPGELAVIKGRSGSGKSTLINMLSGILNPTSGKVLYDGADIYEMEDNALSEFRNKHIGYIPQGRSAIASLTVEENITLPCMLYGESDEDTADELMEMLCISRLRNVMPEELSGGEMRRMAIARALIKKPKVIFADEPTSDLDDENTKNVFDILRETSKNGVSVLIVTHENDAEDYADRLYRMDAGVLSCG